MRGLRFREIVANSALIENENLKKRGKHDRGKQRRNDGIGLSFSPIDGKEIIEEEEGRRM